MPTATAKNNSPPAIGAEFIELIERLGGIDPARVRMQPPPGTATMRDLIRENERKDKSALCELVDRTLVEKVMGVEEDRIGLRLAARMLDFAEDRDLGVVLGPQAPMRMLFGNVRMPDVSFTTNARWAEFLVRRPKVAPFAPDLAVEILSESNTRAEMDRKRREYFASGSRLVWEVNPRRRTVAVYTAERRSTRLTAADTLDGDDVLPGFTYPCAELFKHLPPRR